MAYVEYIPDEDEKPKSGGDGKYAEYDPSANADDTPVVRDTTPKGMLVEALKGGGRGMLGTARAVGKGMMPTEELSLHGRKMNLEPDPALEKANKRADEVMMAAPDASMFESGAGIAGEFAGGSLFGGGGHGSNATLAKGMLWPNSFALPGMKQQSAFGPLLNAVASQLSNAGLHAMGVPHPGIVSMLGRTVAKIARDPVVGPSMALPKKPVLDEATKRMLAMGVMGPLFANESAP